MLTGEGGGKSPDIAPLAQGGQGDGRPPVGLRAGRRGRGAVLECVAGDVLPGPLRTAVLNTELRGKPRVVAVALDRLGDVLLGQLRGRELLAGVGAQLGRERLLEGGGPSDGRAGLRPGAATCLAELVPGAPPVEVLQVADTEAGDHPAGGPLDVSDGVREVAGVVPPVLADHRGPGEVQQRCGLVDGDDVRGVELVQLGGGLEDLARLVLLEPGVEGAELLLVVEVGPVDALLLRVPVLLGLLFAHLVPAGRGADAGAGELADPVAVDHGTAADDAALRVQGLGGHCTLRSGLRPYTWGLLLLFRRRSRVGGRVELVKVVGGTFGRGCRPGPTPS